MRRNCLGLMLLLLMAGCATAPPPPNLPRPAPPFPADAMVTQRAVLTIHGRQFALNGYTLLSATNGLRLIMTENFGHVLADVLVKPDGSVQVVQAARPLRTRTESSPLLPMAAPVVDETLVWMPLGETKRR